MGQSIIKRNFYGWNIKTWKENSCYRVSKNWGFKLQFQINIIIYLFK